MAERGQRKTMSVGGVLAEVSLYKMSGEPKQASHDVKWPDTMDQDIATGEAAAASDAGAPMGDPLGGGDPVEDFANAAGAPVPGPVPSDAKEHKPSGPMHGVQMPDRFIDLTAELALIDQRTTLEGMLVEETIPTAAVPRERVRDARWIASADERSARVLALLWHGLYTTNRIAVVRWSNKTKQSQGVVVPRRLSSDRRALALIEVEWAGNMRQPSERVVGPMRIELTQGEEDAAARLMKSLAGSPTGLDQRCDERLAKRAELLTAAREGRLSDYVPPPEPEAAEALDDVLARWTVEAGARA